MHPGNSTTPSYTLALDWRLLVAVSVGLSIWLIAIDPVVNRDAILYLRAADAYLQDGLLASQALFGRPILSVSIAFLHKLTGIPLLWCGHILTSAFYALLTWACVSTVAIMGGDRRTQWFAAILILSPPVLNDYRSAIMRDPAYWSLLMLSLRELLLYVRSPGWRHGTGWVISILAASVFRFEGLFIALAAPIAVALISAHPRSWRHGAALLLPILLAALAGVALFTATNNGQPLFPAIAFYIDQVQAFPARLEEVQAATGKALLVFTAQEDADVAVYAGLLAVLLLNICRAVSWPLIALWLWGIANGLQQRINRTDRGILWVHLAVASAYLLIFMFSNRFVLERYSSVLTLFIVLHLAFMLSAWWQTSKGKGWRVLIAVVLIGQSLDTLHNNKYRKSFIRDANAWVQDHTPADATIASNEMYIAYFSGRQYDWSHYSAHDFRVAELLRRPELYQGADYLVMEIKAAELSAWQAFAVDQGREEVAVFDGQRDRSLRILRLGSP